MNKFVKKNNRKNLSLILVISANHFQGLNAVTYFCIFNALATLKCFTMLKDGNLNSLTFMKLMINLEKKLFLGRVQ